MKLIYIILACLPLSKLKANNLATADSLFESKAYSQALLVYQDIYAQGQYSPAMLLRMANIYERQGQLPFTLHYLANYYQTTGDGSAVLKMRELAGKNNLLGYEFGDAEHIRSVISRHQQLIVYSALALNLILLAMLFYRKLRFNQQPGLSLIMQLALLALLAYAVNGQPKPNKGVFISKNTYLMAGPSPGADLMEITKAGHRVEIIERTDVWLKIKWEEEVAYVKAGEVLLEPAS